MFNWLKTNYQLTKKLSILQNQLEDFKVSIKTAQDRIDDYLETVNNKDYKISELEKIIQNMKNMRDDKSIDSLVEKLSVILDDVYYARSFDTMEKRREYVRSLVKPFIVDGIDGTGTLNL